MQRKVIWMMSSLLVVFSLQSFSQTTTPSKSLHPKMDKYYPRPQNTQVLNNNADTSAVIPAPVRPVTQASPAPSMTVAPASSQSTVVNPAPAVKPNMPAPAEAETPPAPAVTSTPVNVEPLNTTVTNSNTVTTPAAVTVNKPAQTVPATPASNYVDPASLFTTRLGSSSPQYDTWKKNDNGAGSVTTQSK
ncbi:MAG TPA: hypothetical protein VLS85_04220 [Hanamia sp.]|nr:hypothetical protein [Hanamia sp.]